MTKQNPYYTTKTLLTRIILAITPTVPPKHLLDHKSFTCKDYPCKLEVGR